MLITCRRFFISTSINIINIKLRKKADCGNGFQIEIPTLIKFPLMSISFKIILDAQQFYLSENSLRINIMVADC